jgi:glycosyltransferase involved in cell wall biosynthesis
MQMLPISAVVPTLNRARALRETLASLERQEVFPAELIVIDASEDTTTRDITMEFGRRVRASCSVRWIPANTHGAAVQRNQGVAAATQPVVWFFDDDILFEPECVSRLWRALQSDSQLGGVNAMIVNQSYQPPGLASRLLFQLMNGRSKESYAGRVIGPAINLLPEDREDLPEVVTVEWLNTTCTLYRREALPSPPFDSMFVGYSMMEDLTLSLRTGRQWHLANVRTARIYHDSQPGAHKADVSALSAMELVNRHYVMTRILGRTRISDYVRLMIWEMFQLAVCAARSESRSQLRDMCRGKFNGVRQIRSGFSPSVSQSSRVRSAPPPIVAKGEEENS